LVDAVWRHHERSLMPRTCTGPERAAISSSGIAHYLYLWVEGPDGVMMDCSSLGVLGLDLLDGMTWGETLDTPVATGTLTIGRNTTDDTAAPAMGSSSINRTALGAYAPFFEKGRAVLLKTATVPQGGFVGPTDEKPMFFGRIDAVHWQDDPMTIDISDIGAWVVDAQISIQKPYASVSTEPGKGMLLGAMLQAMLDDVVTPPGSIVISEPITAAFEPYSSTPQDPGSLFTIMRGWAQEIGWELRYRFDASDTFRLTLFEPPRAKSIADWVIGPNEYTKVANLTTAIADIRNLIIVQYMDASTGLLSTVTARDEVSIAKYGGPNHTPRIWQFPSATITKAEDAQALADAVLSDLSEANADQEIEMPYFWPVQIGDLITFLANGDHYDTDQTLAVIAYTHTFAPGSGTGTTTIQARGKVAGAYKAWVRLANNVPLEIPTDDRALALKNFREVRRTPTVVTYGWDAVAPDIDEIWAWGLLSPQDVDPPLGAGANEDRLWRDVKVDAPDLMLDKTTTEFDVTIPSFGFIQTWELQPIDKILTRGFSQRVKVLSIPDVPRITNLETVEGATGLFVQITGLNVVDPQALGGVLKAWVHYDTVDDGDPFEDPDATIFIPITPYTVLATDTWTLTTGGAIQLFDAIRIHPGKGKHVYFEFTNAHGISSGVIGFVLLSNGGIIDQFGNLLDDSLNNAAQVASSMTVPSVYTSLPSVGRTNELAFLTTDNQLYRWNGTVWTLEIKAPNLTGVLTAPQLADHIIGLTKIASSLVPPELFATLPLPTSPGQNRLAYVTSEGKLYRSTPDGSGWTTTQATVDLTGAILAGQIGAGAVTTAAIAVAAVTTALIAGGAISTALIAAGAITAPTIALGAVTANALAASSITAPSIALGAVTTAAIAANAVTATEIANGSISTPKLIAGAVTANELAANSVIAGKVAAGVISSNEIATGAITAVKIVAGAITSNELATGAVTAVKIVAGAITSNELATGAVTAVKILTGTITSNEIAAGAIIAGKIGAFAIVANDIAANAITAGKINTGAVSTNELAANAVTAVKILAGEITTTLMNANAINGDRITGNSLDAGKIIALSITAAQIAAGTITAGKIGAGEITTTLMTANTINGDRIAARTLDAGKIVATSITSNELAANSIIAGKINAGAITTAAMVVDGILTAAKLSTIALVETAPNFGIIQIGKLRSADGLRYLDLNASGSNPFLQHPSFALRADGTATFSGTVAASAFTSSVVNMGGTAFIHFVGVGSSAGMRWDHTNGTSFSTLIGVPSGGVMDIKMQADSNIYITPSLQLIVEALGGVVFFDHSIVRKAGGGGTPTPIPVVVVDPSGPPSPTFYREGDLCCNYSSQKIYVMHSGAWVLTTP
jgi:hypothetical protein